MTPLRIITFALAFSLCYGAFAEVQEMDKELSDLATKLAAVIKENKIKKVAILDFTDLQNAASELGKYVAEELNVDLVMVKKDFSVLDRANLKKIMAEHKLTATGLIDPDNAKKLGQFAGVDALIFGKITPKGQVIHVTAKVTTTDTAEDAGAAKGDFKSDEAVQKLLAEPVKPQESLEPTPVSPTTAAAPSKPFGDLQVKAGSVRLLPGDAVYGFAKLTFIITNSSATTTYGVALHPDVYNHLNLSNARDDEFKATELSGIEKAFESGNGFSGAVTDVLPRSAITITSKSQVRWTTKPGDYRPYKLQTEIVFGEEVNGRHPNLRKQNLVLDIK